jgi:hypothetical protein
MTPTLGLSMEELATLLRTSFSHSTPIGAVLGLTFLGEVFMATTVSRRQLMIKYMNMPAGTARARASPMTRFITTGPFTIKSSSLSIACEIALHFYVI